MLMKIGLIGAANSGKTKLAKNIAKELDFKIVDNYVPRLEKTTGLAYGIFANFPQNFQILFERITQEQKFAKDGFSTITCGTIYETSIYCAILSSQISINPEDTQGFMIARSAMNAIGLFQAATEDYDILFYLPLSDKVKEEEGKSYNAVVDQKVSEITEGYGRYVITLNQKTLKDRSDFAIQIIKEYQASQNDEQTIRGSTGDDSQQSETI